VQSAEALNNAFEPGPRDYFRPYFTDNRNRVMKIVYTEQNPNKYTINIPVIKRVKSLRLISTEFPNSLNNITERNNIILLSITESDGMTQVTYDTTRTPFPFIIVQLTIGYYESITALLAHIKERLNTLGQSHSSLTTAIFDVSYNSNTGKVSITASGGHKFHIKMYFDVDDDGVIINQDTTLWHMLGFPWPYEIDTDGTELYYTETNNLFNYGLHSLFSLKSSNSRGAIAGNSDYPAIATAQGMDDVDVAFQKIIDGATTSTDFEVIRPYRFPNIDIVTTIFMSLNDHGSIHNMRTFSGRHADIDADNQNYFAKIQINSDHGAIAYNTFVDFPAISYDAPISQLQTLKISFHDANGELVDFGKADHSFTLEVITYVDKLRANNYDSQRGRIDTSSAPDTIRISGMPPSSSRKS
jgi:hypothetical protein